MTYTGFIRKRGFSYRVRARVNVSANGNRIIRTILQNNNNRTIDSKLLARECVSDVSYKSTIRLVSHANTYIQNRRHSDLFGGGTKFLRDDLHTRYTWEVRRVYNKVIHAGKIAQSCAQCDDDARA